MKIEARGLGYRELCKVADFIYAISMGNEAFSDIIRDNDDDEVTITYDLKRDEVAVKYSKETSLLLYPEDFQIFGEKMMMPRPGEVASLIQLIKNMAINNFDLNQLAKEGQIPERFYEELEISTKTYKIVETEVECTKYAVLKFMVPENVSDYQVLEYIQTTIDEFPEDVDDIADRSEWMASLSKTSTWKSDITEKDAGNVANRQECFNADSYDTDFE